MASLSVLVYRNGKVARNAKVQLNGPAAVKKLTTNAGGAVCFMGLLPGSYIVNATHGPHFLGVGHMTLKAGQSGVIFIRYPRPAAERATSPTGSLKVEVVGGSGPISGALVVIGGPASRSARTRSQSLSGTSVVFRRIPPGDYSVSASVVFPGGALVRGSTSAKVRRGGSASAKVPLSGPPPTPAAPPLYAHMGIEALINEIDKLEKEIETLGETIDRHDLDDIQRRHFLGQPAKPHAGGQYNGEAASGLGDWTRHDNRRTRLQEHVDEQARKIEKLKALNEALEYRWDYYD